MATTTHPNHVLLRDRLTAALQRAEHEDRNSVRAATLRLILCAARDRDATARAHGECGGCPEARLEELLTIMARQRALSAKEYDEAGRVAEAEREREELDLIQSFLPEALSGAALEEAIRSVVADLEATRLKDTGRCMDALKSRYPGKINTCEASKIVRDALTGG